MNVKNIDANQLRNGAVLLAPLDITTGVNATYPSRFCYLADCFELCQIANSEGQRYILIDCETIYKYILEDFENASPYFCTFLANRICD